MLSGVVRCPAISVTAVISTRCRPGRLRRRGRLPSPPRGFDDWHLAFAGGGHNVGACDAIEEPILRRCVKRAVDQQEDIGAGGFDDAPAPVQHERILEAFGFGECLERVPVV